MGGGGSSGPKHLEQEIILANGTSTKGGISSKRLAQRPPETFKGGKMRIFKKNKNNSSFNTIFLFIYLIISLLLGLYLYYLSRIKK